MIIANELEKLNARRVELAQNLTTMGVVASGTETLTQLVPKVLDIPTDGGGGEEQPNGTGRIDKHTTSMGLSGNPYTGVAVDVLIKQTVWANKIILGNPELVGATVTLNIRSYTSKAVILTVSGIMPVSTETEIQLPEPVQFRQDQAVIFEFLFSDSKKLYRSASYLYSGSLWQTLANHINNYAGTAYSETPYFGIVEVQS